MAPRLHPSRCTVPVGVGASAGGLPSIADLLSSLPTTFHAPLLISQHVPSHSGYSVAEYLSEHSLYAITEVEDGMPLESGRCYVPPSGHHLVVIDDGDHICLSAPVEPMREIYPSVDLMLSSIADHFVGAVAVILSGMGEDGLEGCRRIKNAGGRVIVQDQETSSIWGMPGVVARAGLADDILAASTIPGALVAATRGAVAWQSTG